MLTLLPQAILSNSPPFAHHTPCMHIAGSQEAGNDSFCNVFVVWSAVILMKSIFFCCCEENTGGGGAETSVRAVFQL